MSVPEYRGAFGQNMLGELRTLSARVFGGAEFRAEIALAVAAEERVCKKDLHERLQQMYEEAPSTTTVANEVDVLADAGLLQREDRNVRSGKKFWRPDTASSYWAFCRELQAEAERRARK